jgi:hypothetical protein
MERKSTNSVNNSPEKAPYEDLSGYASIEELIDEVLEGRTKSRRFAWQSILPSSTVFWELLAAVGFASGSLLTMGHPYVTLVAAGAVPIAMHVIRLFAAGLVSLGVATMFQRLFH